MSPVLSSMKKLSPKGWAMIGGSLAAGVVFLVIVMHFASSPSYSTLETGIDPAQTGKITSTLSTQGIAYQLQNNGTAIAVATGKTAQARVALAGAGLLTNQQPGFSLLDSSKLGQSNFQQQVTYERALEGQLDSTIETIDGISSAQVNLVIPNSQDQLFSDQNQSATASVLLSGSNDLQGGSVRGIAQLVASSVPGLSLQKVTITGPEGALLWPNGNSTDGGGTSVQQVDQRYDTATEAAVSAMLAQTLGPGKAEVTVNASLDANRATEDSLIYSKKGIPLSAQTSNESLKGAGASAGGTAGSSSNIPAYSASSGSGSGNSNYKNTSSNTNYGVDKTVTHSVLAPGAVQQQSVSVLVDKGKVPASAIPAIKQAVAGAVGLSPKRGDQLSVSQLAFAPVKATPATAAAPKPMMKYAKYGLLGLASVVFLFMATRMIRKREKEGFAQPTWLTELEAPRPLAALEAGLSDDTAALAAPVNPARRQVEELAAREPDRVAQHLRAWMAEE